MESQKSRVQLLRDRVEAAEKSKVRGTFDVPFRGARPAFVKIRVKTTFPLYRIQSGRTHRAQCAYLASHPELPSSFFDDPEDDRVQRAQHEILLQKINEKDLDADLRDRKQESAIVLTYDGFIVDGNRRVAALREAKEEYLFAVVLPKDATSAELYETELELQMSQDTKADYDWVDELVHIRYGSKQLQESLDQIAKRMRRSRDDVKAALNRLGYVDMFLEWLGAPRQYHRIPEDAEQAFGDLVLRMSAKSVQKLPGPAKSSIRQACFGAIQNGEGYQAIRAIVTQLSKAPDVVVEKLTSEAGAIITASKPRAKRKVNGATDPLVQLATAEIKSTPKAFTLLEEAFSNPALTKPLARALVRVVTDLAEDERDAKRQIKPLQLIEKAIMLLDKIDLSASASEAGQIATALAQLEDRLNQLAKQIGKLKAKKGRR